MKKVYLNRKPVEGPWGGGNKSVKLLAKMIEEDSELKLTYSLKEEDIDVILCIDPKPDSEGIWYQDFLNYKKTKNSNVKIIQRVGDLGTHRSQEITKLVYDTIHMSDHVIFPSDWARKAITFQKKNYSIILNQPLVEFYSDAEDKKEISQESKIRLVTHHWSNNPKKGFEIYSKLGAAIKEKTEGYENIEFTYIGRWNKDFSSNGIKLIEPISAKEIAAELIKHDVYITASILEAGANHVLEAMACNLPVLYRQGGGSIDEYCSLYGISYAGFEDLLESIQHMEKNYAFHKESVEKRPKISLENQIRRYVSIIKDNLQNDLDKEY